MDVPLLAIGASAGGIEALTQLVASLPRDLGACVLVTVHTTPTAHSALPRVLTRSGALPAEHVHDCRSLRPGTILVAPPDRHLLVVEGQARPGDGPRINRHRPAVDAMFASAARWAGSATTAVVLSGALDDGAVGAALVAQAGGFVMVQDPADAIFAGMPRATLTAVPSATSMPVATMATSLTRSVSSQQRRPQPADAREGDRRMNMANSGDPLYLAPGETRLTRLACPDCHGTLAQVDLDRISYYRCHVGHQWSPRSLAAAQADEVEKELWAAIATLEEQAALTKHLAIHRDNRHGEVRTPQAGADNTAAKRATALADSLRDHLTTRHDGA